MTITRKQMKERIEPLRDKLDEALEGIAHAPSDGDATECWHATKEVVKDFLEQAEDD